MDRAAIIDKLRKVRALARHGDSGEKTAAEATLRRLLDRHGITETELDPPADPPTWRCCTRWRCDAGGRRKRAFWQPSSCAMT